MSTDSERLGGAGLPGPRDGGAEDTAALTDALQAAGHPDVPDFAATAGARLPRVAHEAPSAVLLLSTRTHEVLHANTVARDLTGSLQLPVSATRWQEAAGLVRTDGTPYDGDSALQRAAGGEAVPGESLLDGSGRGLWATAIPVPALDGTPEQVLLVLFELEVGQDGTDALIRDRAVVAAGLSFTIGDPHQPDFPLVYVNPAFERTTGYSPEEVVGTNCRFLQGPDTDPAAVQRIRDGLAAEEHTVVTLLNYRKDGTAFWNEVSLSPVYDGEGALTHYVGIQADVTARVQIELERLRHLEAERRARAEAESAQARLHLLAEATSQLASTLDVEESLARLTRLVVPELADWCVVDLRTEDGARRVAARHRDEDRAEALAVLLDSAADDINETSATWRVLQGGPAETLEELSEDYLRAAIDRSELADAYLALGTGPVMVVPLRARRQVLGVVQLFRERGRDTYTEADLSTAADLARRAALTIDNARLYEREHEVAEALQRSMLPTLPDVDGLEVAARYLPSSTAGQVGGDWYDVLCLPDGATGLAVGDAMGHDMTAAAAMGQYRSVLRSYAWQGTAPGEVLSLVDELVQGVGIGTLATALYGRLESHDGAATFTFSSAGHLPPALRTPDGEVHLLRDGGGLLLGVDHLPRPDASVAVPSGSTLVFFTDGLVEDHERDLDDGLELLCTSLAAAPQDAEGICDALLRDLARETNADDTCVLVVRVL